MKNFRKKSGFGGYNKTEKKFGGDHRPTMHRATCAQCGNACEVPFKPNGRKPISCNDCFRKDDRGGERPSFGTKRPFAAASAGSNDALLKAINAKLDMILEVLGADTAE